MRILDNISDLFGDDLKSELESSKTVSAMAGTFSIHAFAALEDRLRKLDKFRFVFTGPSFVTDGGAARSPHREFIIPPVMNRRDLAGTPFEIRLRNKMTTRALARECAEWIRAKAEFRSNPGSAIPSFLCSAGSNGSAAYTGLTGFTASDLGYQPGTLTMINKITEETAVARYAALFDQLWTEPGRLTDITEELCSQLEAVYAENSPARIYHLMLSIIFRTFLDDINEDLLPNDRTGFRDTKVWNTLYKFQQDAALGLRISVDANGHRTDDKSIVHQINVLTIVASESYEDFAKALQDEMADALKGRPREASVAFFTGQSIETNAGPKELDENDARLLHFWLVQNGYINHLDHIQPAWHEAQAAGTIAAMPDELKADAEQYVAIVNTVFDHAALRNLVGNSRKMVMPEVRRKNLEKQAFQELWNRINQKAVYFTDFDTDNRYTKPRRAAHALDRCKRSHSEELVGRLLRPQRASSRPARVRVRYRARRGARPGRAKSPYGRGRTAEDPPLTGADRATHR